MRSIFFAGLLLLCAFIVGGCTPPKAPTPPVPATKRVSPASVQPSPAAPPSTADVFVEAKTEPAKLTFTRAFAANPIDTEVVERLLKARLRQVEAKAIQDLLGTLGEAKPARDLFDALASAVLEISDADARSQTLLSALLRDSVAVGIASLIYQRVIFTNSSCAPACSPNDVDCQRKAFRDLADAAYEGEAESVYLKALGFPKADGKVAPQCKDLPSEIGVFIDSVASLGSHDGVQALMKDVGDVLTACSGVANVPAEMQVALGRSSPDAAKQKVKDLGQLRVQYRDSRRSLASLTGAKACVDKLDTFANVFDETIARFAFDTSSEVTMDKVLQTLTRVGKNIGTFFSSDEGEALKSVVTAIINGQKLKRGDIITLVLWVKNEWTHYEDQNNVSDTAKEVAKVIFEILPNAIREDEKAGAGIRLDMPAVASSIAATYGNEKRKGWYVRATIGGGYLAQTNDAVGPAYYEEIGAGYRFGNAKVLTGPHALTSGLIYQISSQRGTENAALVGLGWSVNLYRLLDVSLGGGAMADVGKQIDNWRAVFLLGLQLPLIDYVEALTSGSTEAQTSVSSK